MSNYFNTTEQLWASFYNRGNLRDYPCVIFSFVYRLVAMKLFLTDRYGLIKQWESNLFPAEPVYFLPKMMICYSYVRLEIILYLVMRFRVL